MSILRVLFALLLLGAVSDAKPPTRRMATPIRAATVPLSQAIGQFRAAGWAVIGQGVKRSMGITSVAKTSTGTYSITLAGDISNPNDGICISNVSGAFISSADFADETHVTVTIRDMTGTLADPAAGTSIKLACWQ